eukprot:CAMPEP_0173329502 /NCGR_PEP_ID=MMETSP1144-20121109/2746_1 /TAXON_ID=483371 /ORGANISM="non described non described, Strain CCMP2298" /LENGTH=69 /DNA_ID=CAMNT_0014274109 /DNA_START=402 /DNA_END=611 /DNA_ORIENTATION=+
MSSATWVSPAQHAPKRIRSLERALSGLLCWLLCISLMTHSASLTLLASTIQSAGEKAGCMERACSASLS